MSLQVPGTQDDIPDQVPSSRDLHTACGVDPARLLQHLLLQQQRCQAPRPTPGAGLSSR
jgi:hypothetical protein